MPQKVRYKQQVVPKYVIRARLTSILVHVVTKKIPDFNDLNIKDHRGYVLLAAQPT